MILLQYGHTALHVAATQGEVETINLLVKYGAAVDIRGGKVLNFILQIVHCTVCSTVSCIKDVYAELYIAVI